MRSVLAAVALLTFSRVAFACQCGRLPTLDEAVGKSSLVFQGTVEDIDSRPVSVGLGAEPWRIDEVSWRVSRVWKGTTERQFTLTTGTSSCDYRFQKGHEYVIFTETINGRARASKCMPTTTIEDGDEVLRQLGPGNPVPAATFWQRVATFFRRIF